MRTRAMCWARMSCNLGQCIKGKRRGDGEAKRRESGGGTWYKLTQVYSYILSHVHGFIKFLTWTFVIMTIVLPTKCARCSQLALQLLHVCLLVYLSVWHSLLCMHNDVIYFIAMVNTASFSGCMIDCGHKRVSPPAQPCPIVCESQNWCSTVTSWNVDL